MSRISAIRERIGQTIAGQRHVDDDEIDDATEVVDSTEWDSGTRKGLGYRLAQAKRTLLLYGLLAVVGVLLLFFWSRPFVLGVVGSPLTHTIVTHAGAFALGGFLLAARQRNIIEDSTWLGMRIDGESELLLGELHTDGDSTVVTPYRGFDWLGMKDRPLQIGELGPSLARAAVDADPTVSMDDPVRIRVDDCEWGRSRTAFGEALVAHTNGLRPDPYASHSDVYLSSPDIIDKDLAQDLADSLRDLRERELPDMKSDNVRWKQRAENLSEQMTETDDDRIEQFINRLVQVYAAMEASRGGTEPASADDRLETLVDQALEEA